MLMMRISPATTQHLGLPPILAHSVVQKPAVLVSSIVRQRHRTEHLRHVVPSSRGPNVLDRLGFTQTVLDAGLAAFDASIRGHCRDRERAFKYPPSSDDPGTEAGITLR